MLNRARWRRPGPRHRHLLEELEALRNVQRGLDDVAAGRTLPNADVVARLDAHLER